MGRAAPKVCTAVVQSGRQKNGRERDGAQDSKVCGLLLLFNKRATWPITRHDGVSRPVAPLKARPAGPVFPPGQQADPCRRV